MVTMPGERRKDDPEHQVRAHVHVALASIVLTFLAPLVSWTLWHFDRRLPARTWKRLLLALAIVDTVLVVGLGLSTALGFELDEASGKQPKIGVVLESEDAGAAEQRGAIVDHVLPHSPAAAAEIQPGDRVTAVDGVPVEKGSDLIRTIAKTERGAQRRLDITRSGEPIERVVVPTTKRLAPARTTTTLFEPTEVEQELGRTTSRSWVAGAGLLELLLVGGLAIAARRRHARASPAVAVAAGLLALSLASSIVLLGFRITIGVSLGAILVSILAGSVALLVVGLIATTLAPRAPVVVGPPLSTSNAVGFGMFYGITGAVRVAILLALLVAAFGVPMHTASDAFGLDPSWGWLGIGLFVLATVVVAPVSEEVLFRGVLLPWLARWMRPGAALAWSTIVFALGHLYYGAGVLLIALYGLIFGWARLRTGKLRAPIILHAMLNGMTVAMLLGQSFVESRAS
jgi:uncharacterized protein